MNSLVSDEIRALNKVLFAECALMTKARVNQQVLFVAIAAIELFLAVLTSVCRFVVIARLVTAEASLRSEL